MNTLKTTVLMALLMGIMIAIGSAFGGRHGAMLMLVISLGMNFFTYWFSDSIPSRKHHSFIIWWQDWLPGLSFLCRRFV